jgi:hypothetical protein
LNSPISVDSRIVCSKSFVSAIEEAPEENKLSLTQDCPEIERVVKEGVGEREIEIDKESEREKEREMERGKERQGGRKREREEQRVCVSVLSIDMCYQ